MLNPGAGPWSWEPSPGSWFLVAGACDRASRKQTNNAAMQTPGRWDPGIQRVFGRWGVEFQGQCVCLFCRKLILTANDKQQ